MRARRRRRPSTTKTAAAGASTEVHSKGANRVWAPGTAAQLPGTGASVKKAADLAQPPDVPEAFGPIVKGMQRAADDVRGLVAAVQANDQAAIQKYVAALEADGKALESIDQKAIDAAQKALFQPLIDSYNRNMKIAAGG